MRAAVTGICLFRRRLLSVQSYAQYVSAVTKNEYIIIKLVIFDVFFINILGRGRHDLDLDVVVAWRGAVFYHRYVRYWAIHVGLPRQIEIKYETICLLGRERLRVGLRCNYIIMS